MRSRCPVCRGTNVYKLMDMSFIVPDGWKLPECNEVMFCKRCEMIWYSNDMTQRDYNAYYREKYGFNYATTLDVDMPRIHQLAKVVENEFPDREAHIADFGGGIKGALVKTLQDNGYKNVVNVEVGEEFPYDLDLLVCSHVMEHVYDLDWLMNVFDHHTKKEGRVLIEIPDASAIARNWDMPILDFNQKHVNHFSPSALDLLFESWGWNWKSGERGTMPANHGYYYRAVYKRGGVGFVQFESQIHIQKTKRELGDRFSELSGDYIVWGCGDYCLWALKNMDTTKINVIHYVDLDPAYRGETIGGKQVLDHVESDAPILVIAQGQKSDIINYIKTTGVKNEVIVI